MSYRSQLSKSLITGLVVAAIWLGWNERLASSAKAGEFDLGDNGIWLRRHWMHEGPTQEEIVELATNLRARGIRRIYPFLGPMDANGWPGWRSKAGLVQYVPERAGAFLAEINRIAPEIHVLPWTGGNLNADVRLEDEAQRRGFVEHARRPIALGAHGIHLNVEPLPSWSPGGVAEAPLRLLWRI